VLSVIIVIISNNEVQGFSSVTRTAVTRDIALGKIHMTNIFSAPNPILLSNNPSFQEETCSASLVILHASTFSSCTQTNPKSKTKIMSSLFSSNSQTSKASNRIVLGLSIVLATMLSKCMKAYASHVSTATSVQTVSPLLSAFQGIAIKSVQQIQLLIKNSNTLEKAIWTVSSMLLVKEIFLNLGSRKRQQKDPTSEVSYKMLNVLIFILSIHRFSHVSSYTVGTVCRLPSSSRKGTWNAVSKTFTFYPCIFDNQNIIIFRYI